MDVCNFIGGRIIFSGLCPQTAASTPRRCRSRSPPRRVQKDEFRSALEAIRDEGVGDLNRLMHGPRILSCSSCLPLALMLLGLFLVYPKIYLFVPRGILISASSSTKRILKKICTGVAWSQHNNKTYIIFSRRFLKLRHLSPPLHVKGPSG